MQFDLVLQKAKEQAKRAKKKRVDVMQADGNRKEYMHF